MTGGLEDPQDGEAVAGTVFSAVVVYAVSYTLSFFGLELGSGSWDEGLKGEMGAEDTTGGYGQDWAYGRSGCIVGELWRNPQETIQRPKTRWVGWSRTDDEATQRVKRYD